jgi:hypothetical protein
MVNNCRDNRTMPSRCRSLCTNNQDSRHCKNGDEDQPPPPLPPPPQFNDGMHLALMQFMADTTRHFADAVSRIPQPIELVERIGCSLRDFSSYHFRTFEGTKGPNVAEAWLTNIDVLFNTLECTDEQKVHYV